MSTNNQNQNGRNAQNLNDQRPVLQTSGYNGSEPMRKCPHCGKIKPLSDFGFRMMDTDSKKVRNQSWCKECRSKAALESRKEQKGQKPQTPKDVETPEKESGVADQSNAQS